jgi:hypothetical protein
MSNTNSNTKIAGGSATQANVPASASVPAPTTVQTGPNGYRLPESTTLQHAAKLAIVEDKPIMFDYWTSSLDKSVIIGVKDSQEKLLVKSEEEYTSPISKIYKVATEYIIVTENSIYLVDASIATKRISS